jgi:dihydroneopterin aldolase
MNQVENTDYEATLKNIRQWTAAQRFALVQDVLKTLAPEVEKPSVRERTLERALRAVPLDRQPPTDEEVKQWLEEHRMEKYG